MNLTQALGETLTQRNMQRVIQDETWCFQTPMFTHRHPHARTHTQVCLPFFCSHLSSAHPQVVTMLRSFHTAAIKMTLVYNDSSQFSPWPTVICDVAVKGYLQILPAVGLCICVKRARYFSTVPCHPGHLLLVRRPAQYKWTKLHVREWGYV